MKYLILPLLFATTIIRSQEDSTSNKPTLNGYLSALPSIYWQLDTSLWQGLIHNRLNFDWQNNNHWSASVSMRNQFIGGDFVNGTKYESGFKTENYFLPFTYYQTLGDKYLLSLSIDRAWVQYTNNKLEIILGRQRINWGQTFVWNPNDIFNTYNYFEFDYPERPGADAIRLQYYTSETSSLDAALKADSAGNISGAALIRFNRWSYDFQLLGGYYQQSNQSLVFNPFPEYFLWKDHDLVLGCGFSGAIKNVSLRGEASYFHSIKEHSDSTNLFLVSLGIDYSFPNQFGIMLECLYNSNVQLTNTSGFQDFYAGTMNVKTITYTHYNLFTRLSYPITPILNSTLAGMCFFDENLFGIYAGPSLDYSIANNMSLSVVFQLFNYRVANTLSSNKKWQKSSFGFLQWKWNF